MSIDEYVIKNFNGLSTDTKPTIAGGASVPNGSRFREVDTGDIYHFNLSDDTWYEDTPAIDNSTHSLQTVDYEHHEIHGGSHYYFSDIFSGTQMRLSFILLLLQRQEALREQTRSLQLEQALREAKRSF